MGKVLIYTILLILGMVFSQLITSLPIESYDWAHLAIKSLTMVGLSFVMIHVGLEFTIDKSRLSSYGWDYVVAFTTATFPWIFCSLYFVYGFEHDPRLEQGDIWAESLLIGRFAAPTSAGVLFTMLAAAGLGLSWVFRKARILAIFDDLDTILLMIPLKIAIIGFKWELLLLLFATAVLLAIAWKGLHKFKLPFSWPWVLFYSVVIAGACEAVYIGTSWLDGIMPMHFEALLPAFVLGCITAYPNNDPKAIHSFLEKPSEKRASGLISAVFMFFVGASMPPIMGIQPMEMPLGAEKALEVYGPISGSWLEHDIAGLPLKTVLWHVLVLTVISNLGKMYPAFCYRKEASLNERIALAIGMCPRGEVGAGIIVVSLTLVSKVEESLIITAMLALALNLILIGPMILKIRWLLSKKVQHS